MSKIIIDSDKSNQTFSSGVSAYVWSGATLKNSYVSSGGRLYIENGAASATTVSKGGFMIFSMGCSGGTNSVLSGGTMAIMSGANVAYVTAAKGAAIILEATASSYYTPATKFTVSSNGATIKCTGSTFSGWDNMNTPGCALTLAGVSASSINVSSGCVLTIGGVSRYASASVNKVNVYNGGKVYFTRVDTVGTATAHAGGSLFVADGATGSATIIENGGNVTLYYGDEMLNDPGWGISIKKNTFYNVVASGYDVQDVAAHSGTTGVNTTLLDSAYFRVYSGGKAYDTVTSGGTLDIRSGGVASNVYNNAGLVWVSSGGKITGKISINHRIIVEDGGIIDFDISGIRGGDAARFDNYYNLPTNTGSPTLTLTVSGRQPDGTYTLATGAYQIEKKTTDAEKTLTVYNTSGSKLGAVKLGQTVKIGSASYSLNLNSGNLSVTVSGSAPAKPAKSDIDGNGVSDVMFQYTGGDYQLGYWMNGTNTWRGQGLAKPAKWEVLGSYDMNSNGKADSVLVGNVEVGGVKGAYIGYYLDSVDTDANWQNIGYLNNAENIGWKNKVGNLTGNAGKNSIVWYAPERFALGAWTDSTTEWVTLSSSFGGDAWKLVGCGDFDGDGKDSVVMNYNNGQFFYAVGIGGTPASLGNADWRGWELRAIGDFAGDGKDDIVLFHQGTGSMVMCANGNLDSYVSIGQLAADDWFVVGASDYNGDGKDDLLVRQYSTGMLGYYSNGNQANWNVMGYGVDMNWTVIA